MKAKRTNHVAQMRAEYDFDYSKAARGKYHERLLREGSNVVVLDRDIAKAFPNSASVNSALREGSNVVVLDRDIAKAFPNSASVNSALRAVLKRKAPRRAKRA